MAIGKMLTSPGIEGRLGEDGVAEAAASLWPEDCQTCGRPLGPRPPALCIDDLGIVRDGHPAPRTMPRLRMEPGARRARVAPWSLTGRGFSCWR